MSGAAGESTPPRAPSPPSRGSHSRQQSFSRATGGRHHHHHQQHHGAQQQTPMLQTLLRLGFSRHRSEKALAATGHSSVQRASEWILAHVNDPCLDEVFPRNYVVFMCPSAGLLAEQLAVFWGSSREQIGWNGAHAAMPHVTLTSVFQCADDKAEQLVAAVQGVAGEYAAGFRCRHAMALEPPYSSPNFIGTFVERESEGLLKSLSVDLCAALGRLGVQAKPPTATVAAAAAGGRAPYHLTLAYQFEPHQFPGLDDLIGEGVDAEAACEWELRLYSFEERMKGNETFRVLYPRAPGEQDELALREGDSVFVSSEEVRASTDGWMAGTSGATGCTGYLPKNYVCRTADTDAWTLHLSVAMSPRLSAVEQQQHTAAANPVTPDDVKASSDLGTAPRAAGTVTAAGRSPARLASSPRQVYILRHGERVDFTFGNWIPCCFDESGRYRQKDLNLPPHLPVRKGGAEAFLRDSPLTNVGMMQARLVGEALAAMRVSFSHAFSSPSLRCVQTCHWLLAGLGLNKSVPIAVEPGLFEWLQWYKMSMPDWMSPGELSQAGYNMAQGYKPYIAADELQDSPQETIEAYYTRNFFVTQCILQATEEAGGNVLLVGHAGTLDACTRQITGHGPRPMNEMMTVIRKVPYCSMSVIQEDKAAAPVAASTSSLPRSADASRRQQQQARSVWRMVEPPVPPLTHSGNARFNWEVLVDEREASPAHPTLF